MNFDFAVIRRSRWGRGALFVAANLLGALLLYLLVVAPLLGFLGDRASRIADRQATLARYEAVAAQEEAVREFEKQVAESNSRGDLVAGASDGIVNANLQARLKTLAAAAGATVRSIQMLPAKTLGHDTLVGARLEVSGSLEALHTLARALEGEPPLLIIAAATLRAQMSLWNMPFMGAAQTPNAPEPEQSVDAQFDVYGGAQAKERS